MKTNLFKEAIADAEAIKKLAIDNAKASLNEAFDSKIKSMLAAKLQEEAEKDEYDEAYDKEEDKEQQYEAKGKHSEEEDESDEQNEAMRDQEDEADESFDIEAILAEMEEENEDSPKKHMKEKKGEDMPEEAPEEEEGEEAEEEEDEEEGEGKMEEEIDLDALIAEMSKEEEPEETDEAYEKEKEEEGKEELEEGDDSYKQLLTDFQKFLKSKRKPVEEPKKESIELQEIRRQAAELAKKVNETNLINAKLLYLNKVLRNHNLSEQQKLKVVAAFDKAGSVKEAKIVYESINEALNIKVQNTKTTLKESLGFASKASGTSTKREIISEADTHIIRWQKLAGIKK